MWYGRAHITSQFWVDDINHAPWAISGDLLLMADLGDYFAKAMMKHGFAGRLELPVGGSHYV